MYQAWIWWGMSLWIKWGAPGEYDTLAVWLDEMKKSRGHLPKYPQHVVLPVGERPGRDGRPSRVTRIARKRHPPHVTR
jgi:hypothetical protein